MRKRLIATALFVGAAATISGCSSGEEPSPVDTSASPDPSQDATTTEWGKGDYMKAMKRLDRAVHDGDADLVDEGYPYLMEGLNRTFPTPGNRPYRLDISCAAPGTYELTLRLKRGAASQDWAVTCNDHEADRLNLPATNEPFTATIAAPDTKTTGIIHWQLNTIHKDAVEDCPDDIMGCDT
ncbi:acetyl-CoA hydrolase/transferase family protein [Streptomyces sp. NBRC 110611]|uniref:hypothetical protein n=1 Tax=Streptomyces sp. NBRC 110611 TaxID=1621259 RepID=UPI00083702CD|nr:hypothetical protein [Streptomyces sp. NBRC 110611]GAU66522.1 acetyl-CoA hydrolase/transferase family protein [Streptomyces sp. NBRC 110611]